MIAFAVPEDNAVWSFLAYRLHTTCVPSLFVWNEDMTKIRGVNARPDLCPGCWDLRVEHDPGDEDRG